jgi:DNA polymerase-1
MTQSIVDKAKKMEIEIPEITAEEINEQIKPVLRKMEAVGVRIDCEFLNNLAQKLALRLEVLEKEIHKIVGFEFNIASPIQMAEVLFEKLKLPTSDLKKTKSGISTAASELKKIETIHPVIPFILEHRELSKLISTYLKPLPLLADENSRIHTTYGLETSTGRITSSEPNLQNIPIKGKYGMEIRKSFVASPDMELISADYSQIELRVVACLANDKNMITAFKNGEDIHRRTASEIFSVSLAKVTASQRRIAKAVNFGIVYGQTPFGLSQALGIETSKAAEYIMHYFDIHKGIKNYINQMIAKAHEDGFVETLFGMRRYLPNINSTMRYVAEGEERMAINTPVQGTASEIIKLAMVNLDREMSEKYPKAKMMLTVHDELVVEAPTAEAKDVAILVKEIMEKAIKLCIPVEATIGIGKNWAETK